MKKVFAIIMSAMMLVCFMPAMAFADETPTPTPTFIANKDDAERNWDNEGKFKMSLESGQTTATAEVYKDYSVFAKVKGTKVDASSVKVSADMQNVDSLGVSGKRHHDFTLPTGIQGKAEVELKNHFTSLFGDQESNGTTVKFNGTTVKGTINDAKYQYNVKEFKKGSDEGNKETYTLVATPESEDAVRTAWKTLTGNVDSTTDTEKNSQLIIEKGAYIQVGTEKLKFDAQCTVDPSNGGITGGKIVTEEGKALKEGTKIELYFPQNTTLQLGRSIAKLNNGVYVRSDFEFTTEQLKSLKNSFTAIQNNESGAMYGLAYNLVQIANDVIGKLNKSSVEINILSECKVKVGEKDAVSYAYGDTFKLEPAGDGYKWVDANKNTVNDGTITVTGDMVLTKESTGSAGVGGGGGFYVPTVQKPEITIIGSGKADLSADGRTATITAAAGHELVSVVLNGKEMGKVEKLTGLKTGDKATITFRAKTDGKAEMDKMIAQKASKLTLMARSKKTAKLNIKVVVKGDLKAITDAGYTVKYKFYRSTKKSAGYKAMLTKKAPTYFNTYGKKGTMYYYKARVMIYDKDGNFVAQTALKQCKYANRLWTK